MTLNKRKLDGIPQITAKTLPAQEFDALLTTQGGYTKIGTAPQLRAAVSKRGRAIQCSGGLKQFIVLTSPLQLLPIMSIDRGYTHKDRALVYLSL